MFKQFNRFLILAAIIAAVLYITLTNSEQATIKLGPTMTVTTYAGVIYIAVFALGCVAASLVALFFGLKGYLRERKLRAAERSRQSFLKALEKARNLMAGGDWAAARDMWEQIINREPENVIARVELSRCLESLGDPREALRVLDSTRASSRASAEVLFRAADLNRKLGNNTAACDNLAFILAEAPTKKALELARDACEEMGRVKEALEFQVELEKIGFSSDETTNARRRLMFAELSALKDDETQLRDALLAFIKKNQTFVPALERLAAIELSRGQVEQCAELLIKAAKNSPGDLSKWEQVVNLWLHTTAGDFNRRATRAIAAARSGTQDTKGKARLEAELLVISTLLATNHFEEAEQAIEGFNALAEREIHPIPADIVNKLLIQKGHCLAQMGKARDTAPLWKELALPADAHGVKRKPAAPREKQEEPSPALSTP